MTYKDIDKKALQISQRFKRCEADLLNIIIEVDEKKVFRKMGHASLFQYVVNRLGLSEALAYNFINVARKAKEVPELKKTIERGELTVCKAKKITSVLNNSNQKHWLNLAKSESQRKVEREVALAQPHKSIPERLTYMPPEVDIAEKVQVKRNSPKVKLELGLSERLMLKLRRAQDLISQKQRQSISLETTIEEMVDEFLSKNDPMEKAKRQVLKGKLKQNHNPESPSAKSTTANAVTTEKARAELFPRTVILQNIIQEQEQEQDKNMSQSQNKIEDESQTRTQSEDKSESQNKRESESQTQIQTQIKDKRQPNMQTQIQPKRKSLPASLKHRVYLRDQGECTARDESGQKCRSQRFLEVHHIVPLFQGGKDELENLTLLCSGHHKAFHDRGA